MKHDGSRASLYASSVLAGDVPACHWVHLACKRHLSDLTRSDVWYDLDEEHKRISFIETILTLEDGSRMILMEWQIFFFGNLYCWKKSDTGLRRFKNATLFIPRKSGKSALLAALMISSLVMDGVAYGQAYAVAADRGQASLLRDYMSGFIKRSPELKKIFEVQTWITRNKLTATTMKALHADWRRLDGLNPYMVVMDEYHSQEGPELDDVINSAFGAQPEHIYVKISTAGEFGLEKPAVKEIALGEKVLEGLVNIDDFLYLNYTIDAGDDWSDPSVWAKANPSLGHCKSEEYLTALVAVAKEIPQKSLDFKTKQLNCWIESFDQWITHEKWELLRSDDIVWDDLQGCRAWVGMDLARVRDLSSLVAVIQPDDPEAPMIIWGAHFIPNDDIESRTRRDKVPYSIWRDEGHIITTDGNTTDFDVIFETIMKWAEHLDIQELAYDRHFSAELVQRLYDNNIELCPFAQGFISMNAAVCGIERHMLAESIRHNGDPVLAWAISNSILVGDAADNRKIDKKRSKERVDPVVALGMAVARSAEGSDEEGPMVYV
jgi:phage terminase large subunit-like protein